METTTASQLYNALSRLGRQIHRMEHQEAHRSLKGWFKMHRGQTRLLALISRNNGASQRDLAEELDVRPSSMTEMLLKLEAAGLITRKQDENDQRVMRIFLTEAGENAVRETFGAALDMAATLFGCLTAEEQSQMLMLTEKLNAALGGMDRSCMHGRHRHGFHHHCLWHHLRYGGRFFGPRTDDGRGHDGF